MRDTQGFGVLTWECAGSLASRNIFFSIPLDGTVLLFSVIVSVGGPDGLAGRKGGPVYGHSTKEVASPVDVV